MGLPVKEIRYHVVMYSGGVGSYCAAKRVAERHGRDKTILMFADTMTEDPDLYKFIDDSVSLINPAEFHRLCDGRDIWQVFMDSLYLGNTRIDPCSYHLKRKLMMKFLDRAFDPAVTWIHLGIDWSEEHRIIDSAHYWEPYQVRGPMLHPPYLSKEDMLAELSADGLDIPSLYTDGFPHNNCGGGCIKAGQAHFAMLLAKRPATYAKWEKGELRVRAHLKKNVSILRDRRGGKTRPMTLREFRQRIEGKTIEVDQFDFGGCACATGSKEEDRRVELTLGIKPETKNKTLREEAWSRS